MTSGARIIVVGDLLLDVVVELAEPVVPDSDTPARTRLALGGAGANVAAWVVAAGGNAALVGRVGEDPAGEAHRSALRERAIEAHLTFDEVASTGTVVVLTARDGTRTMLTDRGANLRLVPADLPEPVGNEGDHLHLSGYALLDDGPRAAGLAALARARSADLTTSVDASSAGPLRKVGAERFLSWIEGVDILRANRDEAVVLTDGISDSGEAAAALSARCPSVLVSDGPAGAWLARDGVALHHPAQGGVEVVDTVGAGDALTAGFLVALQDGAAPAAALAAGVALAARAVGTSGAHPA